MQVAESVQAVQAYNQQNAISPLILKVSYRWMYLSFFLLLARNISPISFFFIICLFVDVLITTLPFAHIPQSDRLVTLRLKCVLYATRTVTPVHPPFTHPKVNKPSPSLILSYSPCGRLCNMAHLSRNVLRLSGFNHSLAVFSQTSVHVT